MKKGDKTSGSCETIGEARERHAAEMGSVQILAQAVEKMTSEARLDCERECCGLLAGRDGLISAALPARNALASATAYEIAPAELFELLRRIREEKLELLGLYHSHPKTENAPSPTDMDRAYYPDIPYFIISPRIGAAKPLRAFRIADGTSSELAIEIV